MVNCAIRTPVLWHSRFPIFIPAMDDNSFFPGEIELLWTSVKAQDEKSPTLTPNSSWSSFPRTPSLSPRSSPTPPLHARVQRTMSCPEPSLRKRIVPSLLPRSRSEGEPRDAIMEYLDECC